MAKKKRLAIYPGTFDPVTHGHLDILSRAAAIFDGIIIAVSKNSTKKTTFSLEERIALLKSVIKQKRFPCPITIETFSGLVVNYAKKRGARILVRGLRAVSDFEYEFQMALMNRHQASDIETVFLMPDEKYVYLSSSMAREVAHHQGDLKAFLPPIALQAVRKKFSS